MLDLREMVKLKINCSNYENINNKERIIISLINDYFIPVELLFDDYVAVYNKQFRKKINYTYEEKKEFYRILSILKQKNIVEFNNNC